MPEQLVELFAIPYVRAGAIVLGAVVVAYLVEVIGVRVALALTKKTRTNLDDRIVAALRFPVFFSVLAVGLVWAGLLLQIGEAPAFFFHGVLKSLAILVWAVAALRIGAALLAALSSKAKSSKLVQARTMPIFEILLKAAVVAGAAYGLLLAWHIDVTAWLASAGIVGIAIGFAAKDTLANLFSGIFIIADAPYSIGDFIVIDGGLRGRVTAIGMRSTRILTRDDVEITVPNGVIGNSKIVNETGGPHEKSRIRVKVSAAYGSDVDEVRRVLLTCPEGVDHVCTEPIPEVRFRQFGESGLDFQLRVWITEPALRGRVLDVLHTKVYKAFNAAGIEIPYNKLDVYVKEAAKAG